MRDLWDLAWEDVAPETFVAYDVDAASYTGAARKPRAWHDQMRALGRNVLGIQETTNERAQQGYQAGVYDVQFARSRWAEVGYGPDVEMAYAVSDGSRDNPTWNGDAIADYGQAIGDVETGRYKFYGNRYAVDYACAGARRSRRPDLCVNLSGGWVPRTWNFDASRDTAAQEVGSTPIPGIDVNTVYRPIFGDVSAPPEPVPTPEESSMLEVVQVPGPYGPFARLVTGDGANLEQWVGGPVGPYGVMVEPMEQRPTGTPYRIIRSDQIDQALRFVQWSDAATARAAFHS